MCGAWFRPLECNFEGVPTSQLFGDEELELAERLDERLNALFHLTGIGGARATKESEVQLFTENVHSPRNIYVMSGDMFVVFDKHKNKKNRTPVLLVPSKRVGGMLFLHFTSSGRATCCSCATDAR